MRSLAVLALLTIPAAALADPPPPAHVVEAPDPPMPLHKAYAPAPPKHAAELARPATNSPAPLAAGSAPAPLKKLTREQAARLDAAIMHASAIEKAYSDQIAKEEAPFLEEAGEMCKAGGFTLDELLHKRVSVNFKTGEVTRSGAALAEQKK